MKQQYLEVGKIVNTHGIKGEMKLQLWCDDIDFLKQFKVLYLDSRGEQGRKLRSVRPQNGNALICLEGVHSIEAASLLKNQVLYINRSDAQIPEQSHYIQDLIGCKVTDIDTNAHYGKVVDVINLGASDIYVVKNNKNQEIMIPAIPEIVLKIDMEAEDIKIKKMKGLFEDAD